MASPVVPRRGSAFGVSRRRRRPPPRSGVRSRSRVCHRTGRPVYGSRPWCGSSSRFRLSIFAFSDRSLPVHFGPGGDVSYIAEAVGADLDHHFVEGASEGVRRSVAVRDGRPVVEADAGANR